jgi:hypothetical protein
MKDKSGNRTFGGKNDRGWAGKPIDDGAPLHKFGPGHDPLDNLAGVGYNKITKSFVDVAKSNAMKGAIPGPPLGGDQEKHPYIGDDGNTHSIGIRPHPHGHEIAKTLLRSGLVKDVEVVQTFKDDRPLIDKLHEATFHDGVGLQYIADKYALRMLLRKAQRFTLDDDTSRMVADFSYAVASDLPTVRELAIPPFPVTWIDVNNVARLNRIKELGGRLTDTAAGLTEAGNPVERIGWLIWPAQDLDGHYMVHVAEVGNGILVSPLAWWWHTGKAITPLVGLSAVDPNDEFIERLTFGVKGAGVGENAFVIPSNLHRDYNRKKLFNWKGQYSSYIRELMVEVAGELRHVFGFLMALAAAKSTVTPQSLSTGDVRKAPNGKPLLPLEHKVMHLHLKPKVKIRDLVLRTVTKHKMREHEVRAHLRTLSDGRMIKVRNHKRGDAALGRIVRDVTKVEK